MKIYYIPLAAKRLHRDPVTHKKLLDASPDFTNKIGSWEKRIVSASSFLTLPQDQPLLIHTGKSNLLVLDFDTDLFEQALLINNELAPEHQCSYISRSVGKPGGHFIYAYQTSQLTKFIANNNGKRALGLDTLYGNTLVFFSNKANETKELLHLKQPLIPIPAAMQQLVIAHYSKLQQTQQTQPQQAVTSSKLGIIAKRALSDTEKFIELLNIITPQHYKQLLNSVDSPLPPNHPDRLPHTESGHMYLVSLANILRLDPSIDQELYTELLHKINDSFSHPIAITDLNTIIASDMKKFRYDRDWEKHSFMVLNAKHQPLEVFKYAHSGTNKFIIFNHSTQEIIQYDAIRGVKDYLASQAVGKYNDKLIIPHAAHITLINRPDKPFGYDYTSQIFNLYKWSEEQRIFYTKDTKYREIYKYPTVTLQAMEHAIGKKRLYSLFLPFLSRKLLTRDHSPLFFVLYGVPHSFKSALINGPLAPLFHKRVIRPSIDILTDKFNEWQIQNDIVLVDEVHQLLSQERAKLIKLTNEITGNSTIRGVRAMHTALSQDDYNNELTFFFTTNDTVKLTTETQERRMVIFKNLHKLSTSLNMSDTEIQEKIKAETKDFAYFLATEISPLYGDAYIHNGPWITDDYYDFQETALNIEDKIARMIDAGDINSFIQFVTELGGEIEPSLYQPPHRSGRYRLRLLNSRPDRATYPGVFDALSVEHKKLTKKLRLIAHLINNAVDYDNGVSTGSRKIEWELATLPQLPTQQTINLDEETK